MVFELFYNSYNNVKIDLKFICFCGNIKVVMFCYVIIKIVSFVWNKRKEVSVVK